MGTPVTVIQSIADRLDRACQTNTPTAPIRESDGISDPKTAYAIQSQWSNLRLKRGAQIAGRKIGLVSKAVQRQMRVAEPDYGTLWKSSLYEAKNGKVPLSASDFMQPRIEGQVAFANQPA